MQRTGTERLTMAQIRKTIEVDAAQDGIFSLLTDLDRLPDWSTITVATHDAPSQPLHTGDTFRQSLRIIGRSIDTEWTVTELDRPRHVAYQATGPGGAWLRMAQTVESAGDGSTVTFEIDYEVPGGVLGDVVSSLAERRNEREVEHSLHNLKELAEHR
jgi:uncharacterized membrane protein